MFIDVVLFKTGAASLEISGEELSASLFKFLNYFNSLFLRWLKF